MRTAGPGCCTLMVTLQLRYVTATISPLISPVVSIRPHMILRSVSVYQSRQLKCQSFVVQCNSVQCNTSVVLRRYDTEGKLYNATFPTGVVTNLRGDMETDFTVTVTTSGQEDDASISANHTSIQAVFTLSQGRWPNYTSIQGRKYTPIQACHTVPGYATLSHLLL